VCSVINKPTDSPADSTPEGPPAANDLLPGEPAGQPKGQPKPLTLQQLVEAANQGNAAALKALHQVLNEHPEIWQKAGNLAAHAEEVWLRLVAGGSALAQESIRREADRMRRELLGTAPTPIERLLVDQVVACYLQVKHAELSAGGGSDGSILQARFKDQRLERVQRRYLAAMKTLSQIRGLPQTVATPSTMPARMPAVDNEASRDATRTPSESVGVEPRPAPPPERASAERSFRIFPESASREAV
jgi:hypothetical protein